MSESRVYELLSGLAETLKTFKTEAKTAPVPQADHVTDDFNLNELEIVVYTRKLQDPVFTFVSDNVQRFGYGSAEVVDHSGFWAEKIHPKDRNLFDLTPEFFDTGHYVREYRFKDNSDRLRWIRDESILVKDDENDPCDCIGTLVDITNWKRINDALRNTILRYRSLVNSAPIGMVSFDKRGEITEFNPSIMQILGSSLGESTDPKDLFNLLPLVEAGISEAILQCLESGQAGSGEFQYKSKRERTVCTRLHVAPIFTELAGSQGVHAFIQDISDQKRAEELIVKSERLKVLGQISRGLGLHFSNFLQVVSGSANTALTSLELKNYESVQRNLQEIVKSIRSSAEMVRWLQEFSSDRTRTEKEIFDFSDLVEEAVEVCKFWLKSDLERSDVHISYKVSLTKGCYVSGMRDQISWAVLNLIKNAIEALPRGGKIKIETIVKNKQVILKVSDNGIGLKSNEIKHITAAFWTTKEAHAGMGLTFNCEILKYHRGSMGVKRLSPKGSCFLIRLPYVQDPGHVTTGNTKLGKRGFRILLVDEDKHILQMLTEGLEVLGHKPIAANSIAQALTIFRETELDAVVCELVLSSGTGWEIATEINGLCADRTVDKPVFIILTGCATDADENAARYMGVNKILHKPVKVTQLLEVIANEIQKMGQDGAFSGKVDKIDLLEYLQLLLLSGHQTILQVSSRDGAEGSIFINRGNIEHAGCGDLIGEEALYKCLTFNGGSFATQSWQEPETRTINRSSMFLLVEAARRRDELKHMTN